jgi:DNA-directed RNA polymerase subunit E"
LAKEYACRNCRTLTTARVCPNCNSTELSSNWSGLVVILNTEKSQIAKALAAQKPGRYALKVA